MFNQSTAVWLSGRWLSDSSIQVSPNTSQLDFFWSNLKSRYTQKRMRRLNAWRTVLIADQLLPTFLRRASIFEHPSRKWLIIWVSTWFANFKPCTQLCNIYTCTEVASLTSNLRIGSLHTNTVLTKKVPYVHCLFYSIHRVKGFTFSHFIICQFWFQRQ